MSTLSEPEQIEVFTRFADRFWREAPGHFPERSRRATAMQIARRLARGRLAHPALGSHHEQLEFLFRNGFFAGRWILYGLEANDPELYLSDIQALLLHRANGIYHPVLENRLLFFQAFSRFFPTPKVHAIKNPGQASAALSDDWLRAGAPDPSGPALDILVRPLEASADGKVAAFTVEKGTFVGAGKKGALAQLEGVIRDWARSARAPYLVTENVRQGTFASTLNPQSLNVVHVLVSRNKNDWAPRIDAAVLRIGTAQSGAMAHVEAGGLSASIEPASGRISRCVYLDRDQTLRPAPVHPETGSRILGLLVPGWSEIRARLLALFDQSSYLRVAGFDLVLRDDGAVLVGGTSLPDVAAIQMHQPLLADQGFADYLRSEKF